jgi:hypothetical protein
VRSFIEASRRAVLSIFSTTETHRHTDPLRAHYDRLEALYLNSGVYDRLANVDENGSEIAGTAALRSLRNPANRVTEFYAAKLDPSAWPEPEYADEAKPRAEVIGAALERIRKHSNWVHEGRTAGRQFSWAGDLFIKIASRDEDDPQKARVYFERIDPRNVEDFDKDERGNFTYLRVATPKTRRVADEVEAYTQVEVWDKELRRYYVWEKNDLVDTTNLDPQDADLELSLTEEASNAPDGYTGYDFIPVVHAKFRDVGKDRGLSCFGHALGQIKECDRLATKLHEMLFPDVTWVLQRNGVGPDGNPLPPIDLEDGRGDDPLDTLPVGQRWARGYDRTSYARDDSVRVGRDRVTRLPSGGSLEPKIPNRNMQAPLEALAAQVKNLEADLPETAYSKLRELELSGRAIRYTLADVYDRFAEAFTNLSGAIIRSEDMALSVGQALGIPGFSEGEIGSYGEDGAAFARTYPTPDPFPASRQDEAEADLAEASVLAAYREMGGAPYRKALIDAGYTEDEANAEVASAGKAQERSATLGGLLGTPPAAGEIDPVEETDD